MICKAPICDLSAIIKVLVLLLGFTAVAAINKPHKKRFTTTLIYIPSLPGSVAIWVKC